MASPSAGALVPSPGFPSPGFPHPSAWSAPSPSTETAVTQVDGDRYGTLFGLPIALFGCVVLLCLAVAVLSRAKKLFEGLPRRRGKALLFHKINDVDDVDEASVELSARRGEEEEESKSNDFDAKDKQSVDLSSMRASVLTSMM